MFLFLMVSSACFAQDPQGVLEPETWNERRLNRLQPPDQVMDAIGIVPGMAGAEIGAGRGRYVVQLAVRVGQEGKIYAEDINAASLKHLDNRCEKWDLDHVETVLGEVTDPKLPEGSLDFIFIISSYHHFADPVALMKNAKPSLKPTGFVAIGEWLLKEGESGEGRTPEQITNEMKKAGYHLDRIETLLQKNDMNLYVFKPEFKNHKRE
jgi:ubiquinone/menaquinone biosynthesis C-methylase UbiE